MNNQGWGLNDLLVGLGVLTFALVFAVILYDARIKEVTEQINSVNKQEQQKYMYTDMEKSLEEASVAYLKEEYGKHIPEGSMKLTMKQLEERGFYEEVSDPNHDVKCDGYVIVSASGTQVEYAPYLKCGSYYETKGYQK